MILPTDSAERKGIPITTGVLDYFPRAIAEVARVSKAGNDQHHLGEPLHWDRTKSMDHADCIPRHLIDRYARDTDGQRHAGKLAWRALAFLELLLETEEKETLAFLAAARSFNPYEDFRGLFEQVESVDKKQQ